MTWPPSLFRTQQAPPSTPPTSSTPTTPSTQGLATTPDSFSSPPEKKEPFSFSSFFLSLMQKIPLISSLLQFFFPTPTRSPTEQEAVSPSQEKSDATKALSDESKKDIHTLLDAGANWTPTSLVAWYSYSLSEPKTRLDASNLHPLALLGYILSNESEKSLLQQCLARTDTILGHEIGGKIRKVLANALEKEDRKNNIAPHLPEFALQAKTSYAQLAKLASEKKWDDFISALFSDIEAVIASPEISSIPSSSCTLV